MLELLMNRRSIRKYKDQEVPKDILDKILTAALTSPSGRNKKPWELIVVNDKSTLARLAKSRAGASAHIKDAGLALVVAADPDTTDIWIEDTSIMATIIQVTSQSLGLGSCWVQVRERFNENNENVEAYVKEVLSIPANFRVECIIALGYPDEEKKPYSKENLPFDKIHYNKF